MSAPPAGAAGFVPLMLQPGWILERHHGWAVLDEAPGLKLLRRSHGPLRTFLLMLAGATPEEAEAAALRHGALGPLARLTVVDFRDAAAPERGVASMAGRRLEPVATARFFGVGTFVIDLDADADALWQRVASRERGKARQAQRAGVSVACAPPRPDDLDQLERLYAAMAAERALEPLDRRRLARMAAQDDLLAARALDATGATLVLNLAWVAHGQGYFLHGARAPEAPAGAGVLAQWELVRALQARGCRHYDLGLVKSTDESDGLYRFKRSLGGRYVAWGPEYERVPAWLRVGWGIVRRVRG